MHTFRAVVAQSAALPRRSHYSPRLAALLLSQIDIGEIEDDEERSAARTRRKAINKRCALASSGDVEVDGDLAAASAALKKAVVQARTTIK